MCLGPGQYFYKTTIEPRTIIIIIEKQNANFLPGLLKKWAFFPCVRKKSVHFYGYLWFQNVYISVRFEAKFWHFVGKYSKCWHFSRRFA